MPQFEKNLGPNFHWVPPVHLSEALKNPQVWMRLLVLAGMMQIRYELFKKDHRSPAATGSLEMEGSRSSGESQIWDFPASRV